MQNGLSPNSQMVMEGAIFGPVLATVGLVVFVAAIVFVVRRILKKKYPDNA